jgi:hypothetical protein
MNKIKKINLHELKSAEKYSDAETSEYLHFYYPRYVYTKDFSTH